MNELIMKIQTARNRRLKKIAKQFEDRPQNLWTTLSRSLAQMENIDADIDVARHFREGGEK